MIDVMNIPPIINHFQMVSEVYKQIKQTEIQILCPFCDDATRANASNHGHLYIETEQHVFYCFRCDASGTLLKLLISTEFQDRSIIELLASQIKYNFSKDYYKVKTKKQNIIKIKNNILFHINNFIKNDVNNYIKFQKYIHYRIGEGIDYSNFLINPNYINNELCCSFNNLDNELITDRFINPNYKWRFKLNQNSSGIYFFQNKNFEQYQRIVLTEGPFDCLNLYLYNSLFSDCIFFSISGKKYISVIEKLILEDLLIGCYEINLIFDKDNYAYKSFLYKAKLLVHQLNNDIIIRGWIPVVNNTKDVADYPKVIEVT